MKTKTEARLWEKKNEKLQKEKVNNEGKTLLKKFEKPRLVEECSREFQELAAKFFEEWNKEGI